MAAATAAAVAASACSEINTDGPVLNLINKRIRALRKKLNRISQMEDSQSQGKTLNKEQEETLRSKPAVLAAVDELEKLRQPLLQAVGQEIEVALEKSKQSPEVEAEVVEVEAETETKPAADEDSVVSDLLNLLYFRSVFDVKTLMSAHENLLTRTHERISCLSYDYVPDDEAAWDPLTELDFDLIATVGDVLTSRPVNSNFSHKVALEKCLEHAKLWLANADQPIEPDSTITYAGLREKLNKIMASDYFTTTPAIKAADEVVAAGGNYTSFQGLVPAPVEGSGVEYQQEEEQSQGYIDETGHVEQQQQGEPGVENTSDVPTQTEQDKPDASVDQNVREADSKEHRGGQRTNRGGRSRRHSNGREGRGGNRGGYQNGRSGQSYEQGGGYYQPRTNYRGRGGRGGNFNYPAQSGHAGHAQEAS